MSSSDFHLQGFNKEKQMIDSLANSSQVEKTKKKAKKNIDIKTMLECPIITTYFMKYLRMEMNLENLNCYLDAKSLVDFIKLSIKKYTKKLNETIGNEPISLIFGTTTGKSMTNTAVTDDHTADEDTDDTSSNNSSSSATSTMSSGAGNNSHQFFRRSDLRNLEGGGGLSIHMGAAADDMSSSDTGSTSSTSTEKRMLKIKRTSDRREDVVAFDDQVEIRASSFFKIYVLESASYEVNIDSDLRKDLCDIYYKILGLRYELKQDLQSSGANEIVKKLIPSITRIHDLLIVLINQLLVNLNDPFTRFKEHALFDEAFTLFTTTNDSNFHRNRLLSADRGGVILNDNSCKVTDVLVKPPLGLAADLLTKLGEIVFEKPDLWYWDSENRLFTFDYDAFTNGQDKKWLIFKSNTSELAHIDLSLLATDHAKLTFWINMFNVLMIHAAITSHGIPIIELTRQLFYRKTKYFIGGHEFSLEDIRDGILFGNQSHNSIFGRQFKKGDERKKFCVKAPILHSAFALSDLTLQSPQITVLHFDEVYDQLEQITTAYLDKNLRIDEQNKIIAPVSVLERKSMLLDFTKANNIKSSNAQQAAIIFVKEYASMFQLPEHQSDVVIFRDTNTSVTNLACILSPKNLAELKKLKGIPLEAPVAPVRKLSHKSSSTYVPAAATTAVEDHSSLPWSRPRLSDKVKEYYIKRHSQEKQRTGGLFDSPSHDHSSSPQTSPSPHSSRTSLDKQRKSNKSSGKNDKNCLVM